MNNLDSCKGCLLGLAVGDAVGTTLEFMRPGTFKPIDDLVGGGPFRLNPGQWTDDTSMAMCLAESLLACRGFNLKDQMDRYVQWYRKGYWSSRSTCFDIGNTVSDALKRYERTGEPYSGSTDPYSAGNGSIMRLAPIPIAYRNHPEKASEYAAQSSRTTHWAKEAVDACKYFAILMISALNRVEKDQILSDENPLFVSSLPEQLSPKVEQIRLGSFKSKQPPEIKGTGYVIDSLEAALWAFHTTDNFKDGLLRAVNLGDDADTTGAVYGQIAGAYYGFSGIPKNWVDKLHRRNEMTKIAQSLVDLTL